MNCKDCINSDVCNCFDDGVTETIAMNLDGEECKLFKDKSKFVELPCRVGDVIYKVSRGCETNCSLEFECPNCKVPYEIYKCEATQEILYWMVFNYDVYDTWYFVTKAEAEAKLKELEREQK